MTYAFLFIMGLSVGSFLNVVIHRLPRGESVVRSRSYCPNCGKPLAWYDNIPVISFLILAGHCRNCRARISWRYPVVEMTSGLLWAGSWYGTQALALFWISVIFISLLLVAALTDLESGIIPDEITLGGAVAGLLASLLHPPLQQGITAFQSFLGSRTFLIKPKTWFKSRGFLRQARAPAWTISFSLCGGRYPDMMTTGVRQIFLMRSIASRPSIFGIKTSKKIRS